MLILVVEDSRYRFGDFALFLSIPDIDERADAYDSLLDVEEKALRLDWLDVCFNLESVRLTRGDGAVSV